jgi:hypothetical protein
VGVRGGGGGGTSGVCVLAMRECIGQLPRVESFHHLFLRLEEAQIRMPTTASAPSQPWECGWCFQENVKALSDMCSRCMNTNRENVVL